MYSKNQRTMRQFKVWNIGYLDLGDKARWLKGGWKEPIRYEASVHDNKITCNRYNIKKRWHHGVLDE
jgi:hypothetical protein